jgi:RNA recognition motif-containing protein
MERSGFPPIKLLKMTDDFYKRRARTIYVSHLSSDLTEREIATLFEKFGKITNILASE